MARTNNLNNFLTDVADAIRTKTGGTEKIQASQFDTEIEKLGGAKINGVVESYYAYAGENISAGDFVQFINGAASIETGVSLDTQLSTVEQTGYHLSAVELPNNKVFIAHSYGSDCYLYGMIVTVNVGEIVVNTDTQLSSVVNTGKSMSVERLSNGNIFIAHCYGSSANLYGMICSIDGTAITVLMDTEIYGATGSDEYDRQLSTVLLEDNRVFIAYSSTGYQLKAIVCRINENNSISVGTATSSEDTTYTGIGISAVLLPNGNVFVAHSYGSSYYLYGTIYSVSGTTITKEKSKAINSSNSNTGRGVSAVLLEDGKVFIAHGYSSSRYLYGIVVTIDGTTMTPGTDTKISGETRAGHIISTVRLSNNKIFIVHSYNKDSYYLYGVICTIAGTAITVGTDTALDNITTNAGEFIDTVLLPNGNVFVAHSSGETLNLKAQMWGIDEDNNTPTNTITAIAYETQVKKATNTPFDGVAKTSGSGGTEDLHNEQVEIYTLQE